MCGVKWFVKFFYVEYEFVRKDVIRYFKFLVYFKENILGWCYI